MSAEEDRWGRPIAPKQHESPLFSRICAGSKVVHPCEATGETPKKAPKKTSKKKAPKNDLERLKAMPGLGLYLTPEMAERLANSNMLDPKNTKNTKKQK